VGELEPEVNDNTNPRGPERAVYLGRSRRRTEYRRRDGDDRQKP